MARGSRKDEAKAGPEWKIDDVATGADPDDWEFYPPQNIPQDPKPGHSTTDAFAAFFTYGYRGKR